MKIFLDDLREAPDSSWTVAGNPESFKSLILKSNLDSDPIEAISFDNDLGVAEEGYDLLKWLRDNFPEYLTGETKISIHSANPEARKNMEGLMNSCHKHAEDLLEMKNRKYPFGEIEK